MGAYPVVLLLLFAVPAAHAADAPPQASRLGERGFQYKKKQDASRRQGSTEAEVISIDPAFQGKSMAELKTLADDPGLPQSERSALKELIETGERQRELADRLSRESAPSAGEPVEDIQYTRPAGYENLLEDRSRGARRPGDRPVQKRRAPAPAGAAGRTVEKPAERRVPADLSREPAGTDSASGAPFLTRDEDPSPPADFTARALERERRMPSFMRADAAVEKTPSRTSPKPVSTGDYEVEKARRYMRAGKLAFAEKTAREAAAKSPQNALAHLTLLQTLIERREFALAVDEASKSARAHPHDARIYFMRALAFEQLGDMEAKMSDLRIAASLDPDRFQRFLLDAKDGRKLYDPEAGGNWRLLDVDEENPDGKAPSSDGPGPAFLLVLGSLMGALLAGGLLLFKRMKGRGPAGASGLAELASSPSTAAPPGLAKPERRPGRTPAPVVQLRRGLKIAEKYALVRFLGHDGTVEIWKAHDRTLDRAVLVKRLYAGERGHGTPERERRLQEARSAAKLHHPGIAELYEIMDIASGLYIVYEYTPGKSVRQILEEFGALTASQVRDILAPVCRALEHAHGREIAHGGLSPERIVVTKQGYIKVTDFVLARTTGEGAERYAAPEAKRGDPLPVSDIYSLGLCCYEMLTGELPHAGKRDPDPPVEEFLEQTLDLDYRTRLPDAKRFLKMLEAMPRTLKDPPKRLGASETAREENDSAPPSPR